ncbi:MAG: hypothetical protein IJ396_04130 [Oscillibacter sp.]|nr:hypothetical protein [Oscillibacter sp.]
MERFPLLWQEETVGTLTVETAGLYTCFSCSCRLPGEGMWHVWLVGESGELRLGLLEPAGERAVLRKRLSLRSWGQLGTLRCARLRPFGGGEADWWAGGQLPFRTPWLRRELAGRKDILLRTEQGRTWVAIPYEAEKPFPLTQLFCLCRICRIRGREYAVFSFDAAETPCLPEDEKIVKT